MRLFHLLQKIVVWIEDGNNFLDSDCKQGGHVMFSLRMTSEDGACLFFFFDLGNKMAS